MSVFLSLKDDLLVSLFSEWLKTEELIVLDSALCQKKRRTDFLLLLKCSAFVTYGTVFTNLPFINYVNWIQLRNLRVSSFVISSSRINIPEFHKTFTASIKHLKIMHTTISDSDITSKILEFMLSCANLESITTAYVTFDDTTTIEKVESFQGFCCLHSFTVIDESLYTFKFMVGICGDQLLHLYLNTLVDVNVALSIMQQNRNLITIDVTLNAATCNQSVKVLNTIACHCLNVEHVEFTIRPDEVDILSHIALLITSCRKLNYLELKWRDFLYTVKDNIKTVSLVVNSVSDTRTCVIDFFSAVRDIHELLYYDHSVGTLQSVTVRNKIVQYHAHTLTKLSLKYVKISIVDLILFTSQFPKLDILELISSTVQPCALNDITLELHSLRKLTKINFIYDKTDQLTVNVLAKYAPKLEKINFYGPTKVDFASLKALLVKINKERVVIGSSNHST